MKKILILAMSCNDDFFVKQCEVIRQTWGKDILDNKYDNVNLVFYDGDVGLTRPRYDNTTHVLHLPCEDDLDNTYKKTYYAFEDITNTTGLFEYDYIFRTNTSTYVNVPLLRAFVESLDDDTILWASELYSLSEAYTPRPLDIYARGNGILLSKTIVNILLREGKGFLYMGKCDDIIIGNVLNAYWNKIYSNDNAYLAHIRGYKHGWHNCITTKCYANHKLCDYHNDSTDFDFLKQFITIQIKRYRDRDVENDNYMELHSIFSANADDDLDSSVAGNKAYSENPSIFIGSICGYIDFSDWARIPRKTLFDVEVSHKAVDDAENGKKRILK